MADIDHLTLEQLHELRRMVGSAAYPAIDAAIQTLIEGRKPQKKRGGRYANLNAEERKRAREMQRLVENEKRLKFATYCVANGLPPPHTEVQFHRSRKWRFDYGWPAHGVALEVEGGVWVQGRHTRGSGFVGDLEKYSEAAAMGWRIIRCTPDDLYSEPTLDRLRRALLGNSDYSKEENA